MVSFIQQTLELGIYSKGLFYSTVTRTKDIKTIVYLIQQSIELKMSKQWAILFSRH